MTVHNSTMHRWYTYDTDIAFFNSRTSGGTFWLGRLIGVADYGDNPNNHPIVLKLETGGESDYFVSFNCARGINVDVQLASNHGTLHRVKDGDGMTYSQSTLITTLSGGLNVTVKNWRKSGMDLTIHVIKINLGLSPGYADVKIIFGPQTLTTSETSTTTKSSTVTSSSLQVTFDSGTTYSTSWSGYIAEDDSLIKFPTKVNLYIGSGSDELYLGYKDGEVHLLRKSSSGDVNIVVSIAKGGSQVIMNWRFLGYGLLIEVRENDIDKFPSVNLLFRPE